MPCSAGSPAARRPGPRRRGDPCGGDRVARSAAAGGTTRRFAAVGGLAAWRVFVVFGALSLGAVSVGAWEVVAALAVLGVVLNALDRAVVLEVSLPGLMRAFTVGGAVVGPARVIPWGEVDEIATGGGVPATTPGSRSW